MTNHSLKQILEHYGDFLSAWSSTSDVRGGRRRGGDDGSIRNVDDVDVAVMEELEDG